MKKRIIFFITLVFILISYKNIAQNRFVGIQFIGEAAKPYPVIVFYLPGSYDDAFNSAARMFEVSEKEFDGIKKAIEQRNEIPLDSLLNDLCKFGVFQNKESTIFSTIYLSRIRDIFQEINKQFTDKNKQMEVKEWLNELLSRIKYSKNW